MAGEHKDGTDPDRHKGRGKQAAVSGYNVTLFKVFVYASPLRWPVLPAPSMCLSRDYFTFH